MRMVSEWMAACYPRRVIGYVAYAALRCSGGCNPECVFRVVLLEGEVDLFRLFFSIQSNTRCQNLLIHNPILINVTS